MNLNSYYEGQHRTPSLWSFLAVFSGSHLLPACLAHLDSRFLPSVFSLRVTNLLPGGRLICLWFGGLRDWHQLPS